MAAEERSKEPRYEQEPENIPSCSTSPDLGLVSHPARVVVWLKAEATPWRSESVFMVIKGFSYRHATRPVGGSCTCLKTPDCLFGLRTPHAVHLPVRLRLPCPQLQGPRALQPMFGVLVFGIGRHCCSHQFPVLNSLNYFIAL